MHNQQGANDEEPNGSNRNGNRDRNRNSSNSATTGQSNCSSAGKYRIGRKSNMTAEELIEIMFDVRERLCGEEQKKLENIMRVIMKNLQLEDLVPSDIKARVVNLIK